MIARSFIMVTLVLLAACERERIIFPEDDATAPLPPAGLQVEGARDGYIIIGWLRNAETDLSGYIVYRAETAAAEGDSATDFLPVDTTSQNFYVDVQRSYDSTYAYRVAAVDASGNESLPSPAVSATSPNRFRPETPFNLAVTGHFIGEQRFMRIEWPPVDEADLAGYHIYRAAEDFPDADPALFFAFSTNTFFTDSSVLTGDTRWHYAVTSVDRGGIRSDLSVRDSDVITEKPVLLEPAELGPAKSFPVFRWSPVPGVSRYLLVVSTEEFGGDVWSGALESGGGETVDAFYGGSGLSIGRTYFWRVATLTKGDMRPNAITAARQFYIVP